MAFAGTTSAAVATVDADGRAADPREVAAQDVLELLGAGWHDDAAAAFAELTTSDGR